MLMIRDEEVLELCIRAVTSTPIPSPPRGLDRIKLLRKNFLVTFPEKHKNKIQTHRMEARLVE